MYLLLDDRCTILAISEMCDKVDIGWRLNKNAIYKSATATRVEVDYVPPDVIPKKYQYRDGAFSISSIWEEPVNDVKVLAENFDNLNADMAKIKEDLRPEDPNEMPLEQFRSYLRDKNNQLFEEFLASHPILWTNGKYYGTTNEDQELMLKNYNGWKIASELGVESKLEWNASGEACAEFTEEEYLRLMAGIYAFAKKMLKLCQWYKLKIINAVTRIDLNNLKLEYSEELADNLLAKLSASFRKGEDDDI